MSVDKFHLATILELSTSKEMFEAFDKNYSATNAARLRQLLRDCQAINTKKNVAVMEKYEEMLNLNAEIHIQKPELAFRDEHLINFLVASMPSTYEGIIDNLNMRDTLTLDDVVRALRTKEIEFTDLGVCFATRGGFHGGQKGQAKAEVRTIARTPDGGYAVQGYSLCPAINCFHCKKDGHGWRDFTQYLATKEGKRWKASDKGKLWTAHGPPSNTIQELASFTIAVDNNKSEEVEICLSCTDNHAIKASQLTSNEERLHSASITSSSTSTEASNVAMIAKSDLRKSESQSWHLDSACSGPLTFEKNVFVGNLTESSTGIEYANGNHPTTKGIGNIKLSCLDKDSSESPAIINDVLDLPEAKANLLSLGQLSEQGVDMKTRGPKMYLHQGGKTIMTGSRIERVWLMNSTNLPMRALSAREVVAKALNKGKNDILYALWMRPMERKLS